MEKLRKYQIGKVSKGVTRKLSLICAFIGHNKYLLLDEPTLGIDKDGKESF